jgi:hypothetical protein
MVNVDTGDYGTLTRRRCGCTVEQAGFETHLHGIGSYEKPTSEGMNFLASDLVGLVEDVLPRSFGGGPTDYQLVEEDDDALPRVSVIVNPSLGELDDGELIAAVLRVLSAGGEAQRMMADQWRAGGTLRVVRRAPYAVGGAKVLPLHSLGRRPL